MIRTLLESLRAGLAGLAVCVCLTQPLHAEEALTQAELDELVVSLEAVMGVQADFAGAEQKARDLYGLVLRDFGVESRQAVQVERLIVLAVTAQSRQAEASDLGRQMMQKTIRLVPADDPLAYRAAAVYAGALKATGEAEEALSFAFEALDEAERWLPPDALALQELRLVAAHVAQDARRPDVAESAYRQIDAVLAGRSDPQSLALQALALQGWARLLAEYGDPGQAVPVFKAAIAALERQFATIPRPDMMPLRLAAVVDLAETLLRTEDRARVAALLRPEIAAVAEHYGDDSTIWADLAYPLAVALAGQDPYSPGAAEALELLTRTVDIYALAYAPRTLDLLRARLNLAVLLAGRGQGRAALDQIAAMDGAAQPQDRAQIVYVLRSAEEQGGITSEAAVEAALRWLQDSQSEGAAAAQILQEQRLAAGSDAAATLLRDRTDTTALLDSARAQLAGLMAEPRLTRDAGAVAALRAEVNRLAEAEAALRARLAREYPGVAAAKGATAVSLTEIRARLGTDAALVVIDAPRFPGDPGLIVAVSDRAVAWHTFQVNQTEIDAAIDDLRAAIDLRLGVRAAVPLGDAPAVPPRLDPVTAHWLYAQTLGQVSVVTGGKGLLYLDLRGSVASLPPQILVMTPPPPSAGMAQVDWLIRHHAVTILPTLSSLPQRHPGKAAATGFLAFADARYDPAGTAALAPLPETAGEVRAVAALLGHDDTALRLGDAASERAVKSTALDGIGTLYFATHGLVGGDPAEAGTPPEAALALTPGGGEDGFLNASEIIDLRLNARIVVLSACNTATGGVAGAEALSGLSQAFIYAGARALLVSHWPVESRSAARLMTDTFTALAARPGDGFARAQRTAILSMIDHPANARWSHPAYWAPFVLVGSPD